MSCEIGNTEQRLVTDNTDKHHHETLPDSANNTNTATHSLTRITGLAGYHTHQLIVNTVLAHPYKHINRGPVQWKYINGVQTSASGARR